MELINHKQWLSRPRIVAGLMTGTSLDGVDAAIVRFSQSESGRHDFDLLGFSISDFPAESKDLILRILNNNFTLSDISAAHFALSHIYNDSIRMLCTKVNTMMSYIDAVSIHGQTVWHQPNKRKIDGFDISSTLQLGSISALSKLTGTPVVGDFRAADIALGGQGAPLVPVFDYEFLAVQDENIIAINIGGIANITFLPAGCEESDVIAFDTGPGNILIDLAMQQYFDKPFDTNGETAQAGNVNHMLLDILKQGEFIHQPPPKSTGREMFNQQYLEDLIKGASTRQVVGREAAVIEPKDIIATLSFFTAYCIAENILKYADPRAKLIISGGGANNPYILNQLKSLLTGAAIFTSAYFGIPPDAKEAMAFAYLAYRTLGGLHGNLPAVTGASAKTILGTLSF